MKHISKHDDDYDIEDRIDDVVETIEDGHMPRFLKRGLLYVAIIAISLIVGGVCGWKLHIYLNKEEISTDYLTAKLENTSELTTQKITYTSRVPVKKGSIPFINKRGFTMNYNATLRAGVDMSQVDIKERGDKIVVRIPHASVLDKPNIDPNSIEFHDETNAIFSWNKKEDVAEAMQKAREDLNTNEAIDMDSLLLRADENTEDLIHTLLDDAVKGHEVVVQFVGASSVTTK